METFIHTLIELSYSGAWAILAVMLLRLILRKPPKQFRCVLWAIAGARLAIPFTIESRLSLIPSFNQSVPNTQIHSHAPVYNTSAITQPVEHSLSPLQIFGLIWAVVLAAMLIYMLVSYITLRIKTRESITLRDNIKICDNISSPFVTGIFKPTIFLPSSMKDEEMMYVIMHEKAHIARLDTLWKPLAFVILSIHWFNPLVWVAYFLFTSDIESACDEKAIKNLDINSRKAYSSALLNCSAPNYSVSACPIAFGGHHVKRRVKDVLKYKKTTAGSTAIAVLSCAAVAAFFLTSPKAVHSLQSTQVVMTEPTIPYLPTEENEPDNPEEVIDTPEEEPETTVTQEETQPPTEAATEPEPVPEENEDYDYYYDDSENYYNDYNYDDYSDSESSNGYVPITEWTFEQLKESSEKLLYPQFNDNNNGYGPVNEITRHRNGLDNNPINDSDNFIYLFPE